MVSKALVAATSRPLILSITNRQESYGYQIIQKIKDVSGGRLSWSDGMLYPMLQRMELEGLLTSQWRQSENGRHRKYYAITDAGRAVLNEELADWAHIHQTLFALVRESH